MSLLSEYDALPGIGHACGHNIIATAGLGAALGLSKLGDKLTGRVRYMGTPAEERGGGKEVMAQHGAFDGVDASMMVHPAGFDMVTMPCIALAEVEVVYHGRAAHASAMPFRGLNALDALVTAYQSIAQLRQHIQQTERIHGIIVEGGLAPNIVPERARGRFYVRARDGVELAALKKRVQACFEAGALATGTRLEARWGRVDCLDLKTNWPLAHAYESERQGHRPRAARSLDLAARPRRLDRHGQRQPSCPLDPPDDPGLAAQRRHPQRRIRRLRQVRTRRPSDHRRRQGARHDDARLLRQPRFARSRQSRLRQNPTTSRPAPSAPPTTKTASSSPAPAAAAEHHPEVAADTSVHAAEKIIAIRSATPLLWLSSAISSATLPLRCRYVRYRRPSLTIQNKHRTLSRHGKISKARGTRRMCGRFTQFYSYAAELHTYWSFWSEAIATPLTNLQPRWHLRPTEQFPPISVTVHLTLSSDFGRGPRLAGFNTRPLLRSSRATKLSLPEWAANSFRLPQLLG